MKMKIYTKTGDDGTTGLFAGGRVPKDHPRIAAYGSIDELNALLGIVATHLQDAYLSLLEAKPAQAQIGLMKQVIEQVQRDLFAIGAELATPQPSAHGTQLIKTSHIERLEEWIDRLEGDLEPLNSFILPGGSRLAGWLHWARTVCRRAERDVVHLAHQADVEDSTTVIVYLNRLSDLLFVMARAANRAQGIADVPWKKE
jgi:cob(I)alamin adenosyltransferase